MLRQEGKLQKDQVFYEKEPWKNKSTTYWEKEKKLKKTVVKTIQQFQKASITSEGSSTSIQRWNTMSLGMLNTTPFIKPLNSQDLQFSKIN